MTESIKIPISWIEDYTKYIRDLHYDYDPSEVSLDDVVKQEMQMMIDEYLEEEVVD